MNGVFLWRKKEERWLWSRRKLAGCDRIRGQDYPCLQVIMLIITVIMIMIIMIIIIVIIFKIIIVIMLLRIITIGCPAMHPSMLTLFSGWDPMDPSEWFTSWKNTNSRLQKVLLVLIQSLFLLGPLVSLFSLLLIKSSSLTSFIRLNRTKGTCRSTSTSLDTKLSRETGKECCLAYKACDIRYNL